MCDVQLRELKIPSWFAPFRQKSDVVPLSLSQHIALEVGLRWGQPKFLQDEKGSELVKSEHGSSQGCSAEKPLRVD